MGVLFRPARAEDLDRLVDIHTSAFPDDRSAPARVRNFTANRFGHLDDLLVAEEGGAVVAHAFLFSLEVHVGGARVRAGGIATLGVAPEARGRGVAGLLLSHLHAASAARGDPLTLLYAFRHGFYARFGYGGVSPSHRLRLHPASIPWRPDRPVRPATGADRPALEACWDAAARRRTGMLARTTRMWDARLYAERRVWLVVEGEGGVEGYVAWTLGQAGFHAATTLVVDELLSTTDAAERSLWAAVGAQRDQVAEVRVDVAADDPLDRALVDPDRARHGDAQVEHTLGELSAGPMVRVGDVARALEARGWPVDGELVVEVDGARHALVARGGQARCGPAAGEPDVAMDAATLASVAFGALPVAHAARLGLLRARDPEALARADALLRLPAYFSPDPF